MRSYSFCAPSGQEHNVPPVVYERIFRMMANVPFRCIRVRSHVRGLAMSTVTMEAFLHINRRNLRGVLFDADLSEEQYRVLARVLDGYVNAIQAHQGPSGLQFYVTDLNQQSFESALPAYSNASISLLEIIGRCGECRSTSRSGYIVLACKDLGFYQS